MEQESNKEKSEIEKIIDKAVERAVKAFAGPVLSLFHRISWRVTLILACVGGKFVFITIIFIWLFNRPTHIDQMMVRSLEDERSKTKDERLLLQKDREELAKIRTSYYTREQHVNNRLDTISREVETLNRQNRVLLETLSQFMARDTTE